MPRPRSPEFRRRAVMLARLREKSIAKQPDIAESGLCRWMAQTAAGLKRHRRSCRRGPMLKRRVFVGRNDAVSDMAVACEVRLRVKPFSLAGRLTATGYFRDSAMSQSVSQTDDLERMRMDAFTGGTAVDLRECTHADGCGRGGCAS